MHTSEDNHITEAQLERAVQVMSTMTPMQQELAKVFVTARFKDAGDGVFLPRRIGAGTFQKKLDKIFQILESNTL